MVTQASIEDLPVFSEPWEHSDAVLLVEEDKFHVHRSILGMWSPVFSRMFTAEFKETTDQQVELQGKKSSEIEEMLLVIYPTSSKQIEESNYLFLLNLADEYMMTKLTRKCENYLINTLKNQSPFEIEKVCLEFLDTAQRYRLEMLQTLCIDKAQDMTFRKITKQKMYEEISLPNYRKIAEGTIEKMERQLDAGRREVSKLQSEIARNKQVHERKERDLKSHASNALRKFENIVCILEFISTENPNVIDTSTGYGYRQDPVHKQLMKIKNSDGQLQKLYGPLKDLYDELKTLQ